MSNPGTESRRGEVNGIEPELAKYRKIACIQSPATLDGGDVLKVEKKIFVGRSPRTNSAGIESLKNKIIPIPKDKPWAANILQLNNSIILHVGFTKTIALIQQLRFNVETIDISELLKAEAGLTCSSIIFRG